MGLTNRIVNIVFFNFGLCILFTLHLLYSLFNIIFNTNLGLLVGNLLKSSRTSPSHISVKNLQNSVKCFPKLPKHLAIIIEGDEVSYFECVKLLLWSICLEIPYISFYSFTNAINPSSLYEVLCKVNKASLKNIKWGKTFHKSVKEMAKKDINGYIWAPIVEVNLFSARSVQENIENVMLSVCEKKRKAESITVDTINQAFKEKLLLPDPCVAIIFGKNISTYGFLPWHLRVTELVHMKTHHNFNEEDFLSALRQFAYCEQRFGK